MPSFLPVRPQEEECELRLSRALISHGALSLEGLLDLQEKGWNDESTERHFRKQRLISDTASPELNTIWFKRMKDLFGEIDQNTNVVPSEGPLEFLDLGCCPGGFSSYILDKNIQATGTGVSLPVEDGGHEFGLEDHNRLRYTLFYTDLTYYRLGSCKNDDSRLQDLPSHLISRSYDVVLLDGNQLRTQASSVPWDRDRLLVSQLIIALRSIKKGGTLVVKLPLPHRHISARVLAMMQVLSTQLLRWKPKSMHTNRGQFYAIAKGVGNGEAAPHMQAVINELSALWSALTFGGDEHSGRAMTPEDLDFILSVDELISHNLDWLAAFGEPLWRVQRDALELFHRKTKSNAWSR